MAVVKYQYTGATAPAVTLGTFSQVVGNYNSNPIFNFDQAFLDGLHSISPTDLGASLPYVNLQILDPSGAIVENLSIAFFQKPFDSEQITSDRRYSERPVMSLKDLTLETNLASGYLYYTNVVMNIKVHRPDALGSTFLIALLFPGMPFLLEYGWNSPNDLLNQKDILLFAVRTYNLKLDASGQIDLIIEGTAFNERFNNTLVGDVGAPPANNDQTTTDEIDGLEKYRKDLLMYSSYLSDMNQRTDSTINDYSIIKEFAEVYKKIENKTRGGISEKFSSDKGKLDALAVTQDFGPRLKQKKIIKLHDLLYTLCNDTFSSLSNTISGVNEFRVIYGSFNSKASTLANKSIAEFPIDLNIFKNKIRGSRDNGVFVPTIEYLLNMLQSDFIENEEYWKSFLSPNRGDKTAFQPDVFNKPDVITHFTCRSQRDPQNPQNEIIVMELYIVDINNGLPITTSLLGTLNRASQDQAEQLVAGSTNFPIVRLGHANSFIKNLSLDQLSDQYMKAALIERMTRDRVVNVRDTVTQKDGLGSNPVTPLTLPLRGTASIIGHPSWKPFRAFYLSTGFFLIDAIYKITSVRHTLSANGFNTDIEFMWH